MTWYDDRGHKIPPPPGATPQVQASYLGHSVLPASPRPRRSNLTGAVIALSVAVLLVLLGIKLAPTHSAAAAVPVAATTAAVPSVAAPSPVAPSAVPSAAPSAEPSAVPSAAASASVQSDDTIAHGLISMFGTPTTEPPPTTEAPQPVEPQHAAPAPAPTHAKARPVSPPTHPHWYNVGYEAAYTTHTPDDFTKADIENVCGALADTPNYTKNTGSFNADDEYAGCVAGALDSQAGRADQLSLLDREDANNDY